MSNGCFVEIAQSIASSILSVHVSVARWGQPRPHSAYETPPFNGCTEEVSLKSIG